jgi:hypothetical protein
VNGVGGLSWAQWGLIFTAAAFSLLALGTFKRLRAVLIFAGICMLAGKVAAILIAVVRWLSNLTDALTGKFAGASVPGIILVIAAIFLFHDLHPKGSGASRRTFWISAFVACCLIAGISAFSAVNAIPGDVRTGIPSVTSSQHQHGDRGARHTNGG